VGQNFLVRNLAGKRINPNMDVLIEDNIGEGIHIHFRFKNGFDLRMEFTISEFRQFCTLITRSAGAILSGKMGCRES